MNEVKHIHLGREQFVIAVDAHNELRAYVDAIKEQAGDSSQEVVKEVELRMAELLGERGLGGEKVVLAEDVAFLKEQLGEPRDFKDEDGEPSGVKASADEGTKRLFRDTEHGLIAGVSAGIGAYLGINPAIIRVIFIILTFFSGVGILIYLGLWLTVPEAKTNAERLQMRGKAVTVDSLKEVIDRADVTGAAQRANRTIGHGIEWIAKVILGVIGLAVTLASAAALLWTMAVGMYFLLGQGKITGQVLLPVGTHETVALAAGLVSVAIIFLFLLLSGIAMMRRKWSLPGWGVAGLIGIFFVGASLCVALGANSIQDVRNRFDALHHTQTQTVAAFKDVTLTGDNTSFTYVPDTKYAVEVSYLGKTNTPFVGMSESGDMLNIDANKLEQNLRTCTVFCIYSDSDLRVIIHAPSLAHVTVYGNDDSSFHVQGNMTQSSMTINADKVVFIRMENLSAQQLTLTTDKSSSTRQYVLQGVQPRLGVDDLLRTDEETVNVGSVDNAQLNTHDTCDEGDPYLFLNDDPQTLTINGKKVASRNELMSKDRTADERNDYNCVVLRTELVPPVPPKPDLHS
ncbi:MAG TPA: PspC domain-containing protein [Candidatus Saccharimonadales bacterium]|jgi:phage shock protein PspC (stress-responsive transcriptional regulator)|nr:PspC domain-containing protein [Candidatus Saccharimonadales bacterium]